jgi:hypothetical protein
MSMPANAMPYLALSRLRPGFARRLAELIFGYDISIVKATTATVGEVC